MQRTYFAVLVLGGLVSLAALAAPEDDRLTPSSSPVARTASTPATLSSHELTLPVGDSIRMKLVLIPAGKFIMGDPPGLLNSDGSTSEGPRHEVSITKPFFMGIYAVTQEQYEAVSGSNPSRWRGATNPVDRVSWYDAEAFCEKLSARTGLLVRLPAEAEREYACRAGTTSRYYFGDDISRLGEYAWYGGNSDGKSHPVGLKKANAFGLYDMLGNMWEWCSDRYMDAYLDAATVDPQGPVAGTRRVLRGGAYYHATDGNSCADRVGRFAAYAPPYFGFRVVVSADAQGKPVSAPPRRGASLTGKPATRPAASRPSTRPVAALPKEAQIALGKAGTIKLVLVAAGKFLMGSPKDERDRSWKEESPQHEVTLTTSFYMGVFDVTQQQYQAVMGTNPSKFKGPDNPVECVSWGDAIEFCRRLSAASGKTVRLPTEAEWEFACRAGTRTRYYFGDVDSDLAAYGWYLNNSELKPHPVGQKKPNDLGLYDMHGNVWQWCADWFGDSYDGADTVDPQGPDGGTDRVIRGGSWGSRAESNANSCRCASRDGCPPNASESYIGFRIVVEPK